MKEAYVQNWIERDCDGFYILVYYGVWNKTKQVICINVIFSKTFSQINFQCTRSVIKTDIPCKKPKCS